jgi:hypothetical protein
VIGLAAALGLGAALLAVSVWYVSLGRPKSRLTAGLLRDLQVLAELEALAEPDGDDLPEGR